MTHIDAVLASNHGIASGVVAARADYGLAGPVAVSDQDGDAAALNRIALGTQTVSVWKDARGFQQLARQSRYNYLRY